VAPELPLELLVLAFPEPELPKPVEAALRRLTFLGDLRVLEAAVIAKDEHGGCERRPIDDLVATDDADAPVEPGVLVPSEVDGIGHLLAPGRTALAMVIEHVWIRDLREALRSAHGGVLLSVDLDVGLDVGVDVGLEDVDLEDVGLEDVDLDPGRQDAG